MALFFYAMLITKLQRLWRRWIQLPCITLKIGWNRAKGNFFPLQNTPDWYVNWIAGLFIPDSEKELKDVQSMAIGERKLRRQVRRINERRQAQS